MTSEFARQYIERVHKTTVDVEYARALSQAMEEAMTAEREAQYWGRTEREGLLGRSLFLIQTLPSRIWSPRFSSVQEECRQKRIELERIRDYHATLLGDFALQRVNSTSFPAPSPLPYHLLRPGLVARLWPSVVLLPPIAYYFAPVLRDLAFDVLATVRGFVQSWLVEPLKEILRTVRTGSTSMLVSQESVQADFDSLERMTLSLAKDVLAYPDTELDLLRTQLRLGVMTPVMEIYEHDMKHPIKSAVAGSLIRAILIQVQKAKVDIDQALTGIDKLLKSQELTFAFVGVAPAIGIAYLTASAIGGSVLKGKALSQWQARFGGLQRRAEVWSDMRRIERILIRQTDRQLSALSTGLLLLSIARLRAYAAECLPVTSDHYVEPGGMRQAFLDDLDDLQDPELSRSGRLAVIERMWRSWADVLGWK